MANIGLTQEDMEHNRGPRQLTLMKIMAALQVSRHRAAYRIFQNTTKYSPRYPSQPPPDSYEENAIITTKAYQILEKVLATMCDTDENRPAVMPIAHALTTLNINAQTHMMAFQKHIKSKAALSIPARLPILISETTSAGYVTYANILHMILQEEQAMFIYIIMENEKANAINLFSYLLPLETPMPTPLHFSDHYNHMPKQLPTPRMFNAMKIRYKRQHIATIT